MLTGQTPDALAAELAAPSGEPALARPRCPAGLPSDLLRRRPDIRAAERDLAAATADIGVAVADLYPRFSLTAAPALVSTALGSLLEWGSRSFSAGAALDWPIFDGGRRKANIEVRNARQEQAMIAYRKAVLTALQDVEDSLEPAGRRPAKLAELEQAARERRARRGNRPHPLSRRPRHPGRRASGAGSAASRWRNRVIETRGALARDTVALVKALGGGWQEEMQ